MTIACPRLVIAGSGSGVGKTSLTVGLVRCLVRRGLRVQTFKVGPDFLDPTYLALASGRPCYNLDGWMTSREYVRGLFARATADADIALVEGVMGMFDGASPSTLEGSTAEIAAWLDAPVLLVVDARGAARSLAATVKGFSQFEPGVGVAGVIANRGGSSRHRAWLVESLAAAATAPLFGMTPNGSLPTLPSRHLGLVAADQANLSTECFDSLAQVCEQHMDVSAIVELAGKDFSSLDCSTGGLAHCVLGQHSTRRAISPAKRHCTTFKGKIRLGIARDEAFHFYYADNIESFEQAGAECVPFSPLADTRLPEDLDGLYIGGGYPEMHAARLAGNAEMLADVRRFAASGRAVYAECGGLMYLGQTLTALDGARYPLAGVLPIQTTMIEKLRALGYTEVTLKEDSLWGPCGTKFRGHEFHYSELSSPLPADSGWQRVYSIERRSGEPIESEGFQKGRILASYVHVHFASHPRLIESFLANCGDRR